MNQDAHDHGNTATGAHVNARQVDPTVGGAVNTVTGTIGSLPGGAALATALAPVIVGFWGTPSGGSTSTSSTKL